MTKILLNNIKIPFEADDSEIFEAARRRIAKAGLNCPDFAFRLYKRSIDARKNDAILFVCSVLCESENDLSLSPETLKRLDGALLPEPKVTTEQGSEKMSARPVVVGLGPAGMFCALLLAENGYAPIVLERGADVDGRTAAVERFYRDGQLDPDSNIQFGAGGAGTFSDGKLTTRVNDPACSFVLEKLHQMGAPKEILYRAKPHVGTDVLREVVKNFAAKITELGGEIRYNTRLDSIENSRAQTSDGEIDFGALVLAIGHSARDTYKMLLAKSFTVEPKQFSVGLRIEHLQSDIDRGLFGKNAGNPKLGKGEYTLSDTKGQRGVYTFCMCPGGEVVGAASEEGGVVVNGMSRFARDGRNANSAVAVSVFTSDYGNTAMGAIEYQRNLERAAFAAGGSDYSAPMQTVGDFFAGKAEKEPSRILPSYMESGKCRVARLDALLPQYITSELRRGLNVFDKKISGFAAPDAVLTGVETRTSAPVRILRGDDLCACGHDKVYPCGEGAGYAGGITSAALDGIRCALAIMKRFAPYEG